MVQWGDPAEDERQRKPIGSAKADLPAEFDRAPAGRRFDALPDGDGWAPQVGFADGLPAGRDPKAGTHWLAHCYGAVGAGRNNEADSSNGTELYVVTGQSPRQLDRNMSMVGPRRAGHGVAVDLPRGTGPLGFYEKPAQRVASGRSGWPRDVPRRPSAPRSRCMRTGHRRCSRNWSKRAATAATSSTRCRRGHIDLCNVPLPVRRRNSAERRGGGHDHRRRRLRAQAGLAPEASTLPTAARAAASGGAPAGVVAGAPGGDAGAAGVVAAVGAPAPATCGASLSAATRSASWLSTTS